ncbi:MAG: NifX-associated nitrogen fixation protein [Campylobacterota bacterium]
MENLQELFKKTLVGQIRALDQFGSWESKSDDELLTQKYIKTKEDLKNIPIIADIDDVQTKDIRLIFQALALAFEKLTGVMCSVVMEMSHEGFGRAVVIADKIVVVDKFFKDAHRFGYRTLEDLDIAGEKFLSDGIKIYNSFKG